MRYVLRLVGEHGPISRPRILTLSDLSASATAAALRTLYLGAHVTQDPTNRYRVVPDLKISRAEARREVLRRIVRSLGVTSAEALSAYTRFEYNMAETRALLREFEEEGWLRKGFLARGERTLYWILAEDLDGLDALKARARFVLTPLDNLALFFRGEIVVKFRTGYCYVVFDGPEMIAAFKAKRRKTELVITEFMGDPAGRKIVEEWERENEIEVGEHVERISDHEVMEWYAKMYGRGAADEK